MGCGLRSICGARQTEEAGGLMRIIGGELGGREIRTPPRKTLAAQGLRPAMGRTREALFSMLQSRGISWNGLLALDLFAGTGSCGFEALSRGARFAVFVDNSKPLCDLLAENAAALGVSGRCSIICSPVDAYLRLRPQEPFGLVFIDPPYRRNLGQKALGRLNTAWLAEGAFMASETEKGCVLQAPRGFEHLASRNFGQTCLDIWRFCGETEDNAGHPGPDEALRQYQAGKSPQWQTP